MNVSEANRHREGWTTATDDAKNYASKLLAYIFEGEEGDRDLITLD